MFKNKGLSRSTIALKIRIKNNQVNINYAIMHYVGITLSCAHAASVEKSWFYTPYFFQLPHIVVEMWISAYFFCFSIFFGASLC
jgi:hypothetical protein